MISETPNTTKIRLAASRLGSRLFRNNSGAMVCPRSGRLVRFGLGNESKRVNEQLKSSDLIGPTPYVIRPEDVGRTVAIFTSVEVKRPGWCFSGTPRELAQLAWINLVKKLGGFAGFAQSEEDLINIIDNSDNRRYFPDGQ